MASNALKAAVQAWAIEQAKFKPAADRLGELETRYQKLQQRVANEPLPTNAAERDAYADLLALYKSATEVLNIERAAVDALNAEANNKYADVRAALESEPYVDVPGYNNPNWPPK